MRDSAIKLIIMGALLPSAWLRADNEHLATLQVGAETYTNVTVTSVSASEIFFTHSRGLGNAKLRNLGLELRNKFHFDATKAVEIETEQSQANALFLAKISREPYRTSVRAEPDTTVSVEMADPAVEYKHYDLSQGKPRK